MIRTGAVKRSTSRTFSRASAIAAEQFCYRVYGLELETPFASPDLLPGTRPSDLRIDLGDFSFRTQATTSFFCFTEGFCEVDYAEMAGIRIMISRGESMTVMPVNDRYDPATVHEFLQGSCLAAVLLQRKSLPLHGNVVDTPTGAVAFMGLPRAGKSTTSALFVRRGYPLMSDDICAVRFGEDGQPEIKPGIPRVKLRSESLGFLGLSDLSLAPVPLRPGKFYWPSGERFQPSPRPIRRLYILRPSDVPSISIRHLRGAEKLLQLADQIYRFGTRELVAPFPWLVPELARLADKTSIALVERPQDGNLDFELVERLEADLEKNP